MLRFTPVSGSTLDVVGVGLNRIGTLQSMRDYALILINVRAQPARREAHLTPHVLAGPAPAARLPPAVLFPMTFSPAAFRQAKPPLRKFRGCAPAIGTNHSHVHRTFDFLIELKQTGADPTATSTVGIREWPLHVDSGRPECANRGHSPTARRTGRIDRKESHQLPQGRSARRLAHDTCGSTATGS